MSGLERYGIKDVGYGNRTPIMGVHMKGVVRESGTVALFANGSYIASCSQMISAHVYNDGARLYTVRDINLWLNEVEVE